MNAIKVDLTVATDRINKFIAVDGDQITIESTISKSYLAYALKEGKIKLNDDSTGFTWVPKVK